MLVDPSKKLEEDYEVLLEVESAIIEALRPGRKLREVYEIGLKTLKDKKPMLVENLVKNNFGLVQFCFLFPTGKKTHLATDNSLLNFQ